MPKWSGRWKGGRYYLDEQDRPVYFIESYRPGIPRALKLATHDLESALAELALFKRDPVAYCLPPTPTPKALPADAVEITEERIALYIESIRGAVLDHRRARAKYLADWAAKGLDLRSVDRRTLRLKLGEFAGGHRGRTEALNAFARFLVKEGELPSWNPLVNHRDPESTRAERVAYSLDELRAKYVELRERAALCVVDKHGEINTRVPRAVHPRVVDVFLLRAMTGMHETEVEQLEGARLYTGPLPDKGVGIRTLGDGHEIRGVLQVMHKSRRRHRQPLSAPALAAALRLREGVPSRTTMHAALDPMVPSNLRHTFITLAGEVGKVLTYSGSGVDRARVAQAVGHRAGSTMTADRYEKAQVPPMIVLPLAFDELVMSDN